MLFVQCERALLFHFLFLTLGPALPKKLRGNSMLEIQGDVFIFGGYVYGYEKGYDHNSAIYQLSCSTGICSWATFSQALKIGRDNFVAIPVPDSFCT